MGWKIVVKEFSKSPGIQNKVLIPERIVIFLTWVLKSNNKIPGFNFLQAVESVCVF